jgi:hypothetical protein
LRRGVIPKEIPYIWSDEELLSRNPLNNPPPPARLAQFESVLAFLEYVRRRPELFFVRLDANAVHSSLWFLQAGFRILGYEFDREVYREVIEERGWSEYSTGYWTVMERRKWTPDKVINEMLVVEIEVWRRLLKKAQGEIQSDE